ncbi:MAG: radical SAM protein [Candidatus Omnitrophota bacterium]
MKISDAIKVSLATLRDSHLSGAKNLALAFLSLKSEPVTMLSYPVMIQVEPTLHCNLQCVMCANPLSKRSKKHMTMKQFKAIVDGMPFLKKMSLVGSGEPLLNPELFKMIEYAKRRDIMVGFATNAMLLDEKKAKAVLNSRADWINFSIDSADTEKYGAIRKGADLDIVAANIKRFIRMKAGSSTPEVSAWFVMMEDNIADLPDVIRFAKSLGVDIVSAQLEHNWSNDKIKSDMEGRYAPNFYDKIRRAILEAKKAAGENKVAFNYVNVPDVDKKRGCKWPWKSCYVTAEGFVTPCCLQGSDPSIINFGNVFIDDFRRIWNNAAYKDFRKALKSNKAPEICAGCTAYFENIKI